MAEETSGVVANPLAPGSDPHSTETAAADFSAMLRDEAAPAPRKPREREPKPASRSPVEPDSAESRDDGQSERQPDREREEPESPPKTEDRDPILDDAPEGENQDKDDRDDDGPDDQDEDDDQDDENEDDDSDEKDPFLDAEHEVTVNGEKVKVTGREALAGYMKEADYRQGTERNAREYEEIQDYARETVDVRNRTDTTLQQALDLIAALQPSKEDWEALERDNPQGYIAAQKHWAGLLEKARGAQTARDQLLSDQTAQTQAEQARYLELQERELLRQFPALRDDKKAEAFRSKIFEYGQKLGYTKEQLIAGATDHRMLVTLYKAAKYDEIRATSTAAGKKAGAKAPKNSAENRPRPPSRNANRNAKRDADRRLQRTGSLQDAASSFAEMIRGEA